MFLNLDNSFNCTFMNSAREVTLSILAFFCGKTEQNDEKPYFFGKKCYFSFWCRVGFSSKSLAMSKILTFVTLNFKWGSTASTAVECLGNLERRTENCPIFSIYDFINHRMYKICHICIYMWCTYTLKCALLCAWAMGSYKMTRWVSYLKK